MRDFNKINPSVWSSKRFNALTDDGKLFYLYCLTSPHSNAAGCYRLRRDYLMVDLKWSAQKIDTVCDTVCHTLLIQYDRAEEVVFIDRWFEYNQPHNPKHCLKIISDLAKIPNTDLRVRAAQALEKFVLSKKWDTENVLTKLASFLIKPEKTINYDTVSDTVSRLGETETKTETETETKKEIKPIGFTKKKIPPLKLGFEDLTVDMLAPWLADKRVNGKYHAIDEYDLLEMFKDYCRSKNPKYVDYLAAFRNSFNWPNAPTKLQRKTNGPHQQKPNHSERADAAEQAALDAIFHRIDEEENERANSLIGPPVP